MYPGIRFEIERKLRLQKKAERAKEKSTKWKSDDYKHYSSIDHKERSKERKKNIEENRGKIDKRVNAMAELKARRQGKQKREEEETARREEQRKKEEEEEKQSAGTNSMKLKTSDIYSDDSDSEGRKFIVFHFCVCQNIFFATIYASIFNNFFIWKVFDNASSFCTILAIVDSILYITN